MFHKKKLISLTVCTLMQGTLNTAHAGDFLFSIGEAWNKTKESVQNLVEDEDQTQDAAATERNFSTASANTKADTKINDTRRLPNGTGMLELQLLLNQLGKTAGYSTGKPDGQFGNQTRQAIMAFQKQQRLTSDGKPTYALLEKVRRAAGKLPVDEPATADKPTATAFILSQCVSYNDLTEARLLDGLYKELTADLPIDIRPYLAGFCMPENKGFLEGLYLFLVSQGAAHARLTLVKYDALVDYYAQAGVDLGIRKDAFKRSIESLDSDLRHLAKDRRKGTEKLLDHYESEEARQLLEALPAGYEKLEAKYREGARTIMGEALTNSVSSTFYLSRSTLVGRELLRMIDIDGESQNKIATGSLMYKLAAGWDHIKTGVEQWHEGARIAAFVTDKKGEMKDMLMSSTYAIKTFTQDIEDVPRLKQDTAEQELIARREANGVTLNEFEAAFEGQQQDQLRKAKV